MVASPSCSPIEKLSPGAVVEKTWHLWRPTTFSERLSQLPASERRVALERKTAALGGLLRKIFDYAEPYRFEGEDSQPLRPHVPDRCGSPSMRELKHDYAIVGKCRICDTLIIRKHFVRLLLRGRGKRLVIDYDGGEPSPWPSVEDIWAGIVRRPLLAKGQHVCIECAAALSHLTRHDLYLKATMLFQGLVLRTGVPTQCYLRWPEPLRDEAYLAESAADCAESIAEAAARRAIKSTCNDNLVGAFTDFARPVVAQWTDLCACVRDIAFPFMGASSSSFLMIIAEYCAHKRCILVTGPDPPNAEKGLDIEVAP